VDTFRKYNLITGWLVWAIATLTYMLTIEPTASFWDCGEFIATTYKLEVGHPPGAPLFMIMGRFFSLFAFGDVTHVAMMVNAMSALASSFTILFLFWTITHISKRIFEHRNKALPLTTSQLYATMGAAAVGALAYTFSDTFWFSAVEGEVYATSSLFTAVVFWAILKWENVADEKYANRWIILIAYLMGLSIGVHLLNLLAIPAIVMVYYFKKYKTTRRGVIYASLVSVVILGAIQYGIIPGLVKVASWFELLFVNSFGMPYNSGVIFYALLIISLIVVGLYYTYQHRMVVANTIILAVTVIIIGYSSFAMIVIRSLANPPMDENNPDNVFALLSYLNREQYGDRPLVTGQYFNAPVEAYEEGKNVYTPLNGRYEITDQDINYKYYSEFTTIFPRMYSRQDSHIEEYMNWADLQESELYFPYTDESGNVITGENGEVYYDRNQPREAPSFGSNLKFFFKYQVGLMYFRYFMWNFSGRQNDLQGHGSMARGNWISGIPFIDYVLIGNQDLPEDMKNNKSRNKYYLLPLLLGIIGLLYMLNISPKYFTIVTLLFVFTGIAIIVYLNQTPLQPRERDYAYAGSFYVFTIWIGFGVLSVFNAIAKKMAENKHSIIAIGTSALLLLAVPVNMAMENWDDHDRSGRYTTRDLASNYLESCAPNAIIFTYGDNDTFPLWYAQEVEGIRTDVRVVNLSLLGTDWYINQMKRKAYTSEAVPFTLTYDKYIQGKRDLVMIQEQTPNHIELKDAMLFVASDAPETKLVSKNDDEEYDFFPSKNFKITIDSAQVMQNGVIPAELAGKMVKEIKFRIDRRYISKSELMVLDLVANNNWERPIYFAGSIGTENFLGLEKYFRLEGFAYRLVPIETNGSRGEIGYINTDLLYNNLMGKFAWGRIKESDFFVDNQILRTINIMEVRDVFTRLASQLLKEGKRAKAIEVLDKCVEELPHYQVPFDGSMVPLIEVYYQAGEFEKGNAIVKLASERCLQHLSYYMKLSSNASASYQYDKRIDMNVVLALIELAKTYNQSDLAKEIEIQTLSF